MNTPVYAAATLLTDPPFHAKLREDIVDGDSDSELRDEVPVFHGLSVSGDVRGNFVYVGYGRKKDFDLLKQRGRLLIYTMQLQIVVLTSDEGLISTVRSF